MPWSSAMPSLGSEPEFQVDRIVTVVGSFDTTRGEPQIVVDEVFAVGDLPSRLATRLEILFDETGGEPDGDSIQHRMRFVSGHLRQASGSVQSLEGRPVETYVHLNLADGRRVVLSAPGQGHGAQPAS